MNWRDHITADPDVCHGKPCIKGTRVLVSALLDNLAAGDSVESVAKAYNVSPDDIRASLSYAADVAAGRVIELPAA